MRANHLDQEIEVHPLEGSFLWVVLGSKSEQIGPGRRLLTRKTLMSAKRTAAWASVLTRLRGETAVA